MFCPKCGTKLSEKAEFCSNCGISLKTELINYTLETTTEKLKKKSSSLINPLLKKTTKFCFQFKKQISIGLFICFIIAISFLLYSKFHDFTKLSWDSDYPDVKVNYTTPTTLNLHVLAYDKEDKIIDNIKFTSNSGEVSNEGAFVKWTLPNSPGKYMLTATSPSGKKIKKIDTDGDGINDGDELDLGLDPLKIDSKNDGLNDNERNLEYTIDESSKGVKISISGQGNIASSTIDLIENDILAKQKGTLNTIYNFSTKGKITKADVNIKYDLKEINEKGLDENNLTLYYFNEETKDLEVVPTTVDLNNKTISATLKHFSKYVIGDKNTTLKSIKSEIMFVIDNSVSMYTESQMSEAGYGESTGAVGNDPGFKRLSLTNKMIDMFTGNYEFGVAEFSGNYVNLSKFTHDSSKIKDAVNKMRSAWQSNGDGTNIITALNRGISEFTKDNNSHYLILLTDGKNTEGSLSSKKSAIINSALEKDVKICVIGLGKDLDTKELQDIANNTGCKYYNALDSNALDDIYRLVGANINYNLADTDNDNNIDGMINIDSGFIVTRDGFPFRNFSSVQSLDGMCYGMATFAKLYYENKLPLVLEAKEVSKFYLLYLKTIKLSSGGYDLNNTYFAEHQPLYEYTIKNEIVDWFLNSKIPNDYRDRIEDNTLMINKTYYDKMATIGLSFEMRDSAGDGYQKIQGATLNFDNDSFRKNVEKDDQAMLNALWRLFILQLEAKSTSFTADPDKAFQELITGLKNKEPLVIGMTAKEGGHAINAIRLVQDINDANKFKIEVYDNNYPGETRYIEVERSKYSKFALDFTAWTNEYNYTFKYDYNNSKEAKEITLRISYPNVS